MREIDKYGRKYYWIIEIAKCVLFVVLVFLFFFSLIFLFSLFLDSFRYLPWSKEFYIWTALMGSTTLALVLSLDFGWGVYQDILQGWQLMRYMKKEP